MLKTENKFFIFDKPRKISVINCIKSVVTFVESIFYKMFLVFFVHARKNTKKYYVSICGIFKDEAPYLKEWIEYHKVIGVNHIYLYNNNSSDDYLKILDKYIREGFVTLIEWPHDHKQMQAYKDCIKRYKNETYWLGFIDIDEFINPVKYKDLPSFLQKFENRPSVLLYWKVFGSSGILSRDLSGLVTEDFTSCWPKYDDIGKCFLNTNYSLSDKQPIFHHMLWTKCHGIDLPPVNCFDKVCSRDWYNPVSCLEFPIQINHYVLKSYSEYIGKTKKTDVFFKKVPKNKKHFLRHERFCTVKDYSIQRFLIDLKLSMK